jgi:GTP-binding protein
MFIDEATIRCTAGDGGKGCVSMRREKFVPRGGPDGGDGGDGGSIYIEARENVSSLLDLRYQPLWRGERGEHGLSKNMHGKNSPPTIVPVPPGTVIKDPATGEILADLAEPGQRFLAARGGRGGRGNARFQTGANRAPRFAEKGEPGEDREYKLELKLIAEVGIVGLPNAGKSTLLSAVSAARPKIADYPFTTLSPNLGVATLSGYRTLTIADIPGIIEGAAEGKGLGHDFLRHIERTQVLLFLIDLGDEDPRATARILDKELRAYSPALAERRRVYAFNKADVPENAARFPAIATAFPGAHCLSAATGTGVPELLEDLWQTLQQERQRKTEALSLAPQEEGGAFRFTPPFQIQRRGDAFEITGERVVRAVRMTDFENPEAARHLQKTLDGIGVFRALKRLGAQPGDTIHVADIEMEYRPE